MKMAEKCLAVLLAVSLLLSLSGCFPSGAEDLYSLPEISDTYRNLQEAVDDVLKEGAIPDTFAIQFGGTYREGFKTRLAAEYEFLRDKVNIAGWTIGDVDDTGIWQEMYDLGYRMIMTNNYLELVRFASEKIK